MGRRKIEIKAIKDDRNRSVTFLKRKGGLFKKAHELSVLCSVDVAVIIFGHNKKLYEYSSGDIHEFIQRHNYYGGAHEHKGPADFTGRRDGDDDDDDDVDEAAIEEQMAAPDQHMLPHLQNQPGYSHMRHAPSASPPIGNGVMPYHARGHTPQPPQMGSRPSSRNANAIRRPNSTLGQHQVSHAPQMPNGYAYMQAPGPYGPPPPPPQHQQQQQQQQQQHGMPMPHPGQQPPPHPQFSYTPPQPQQQQAQQQQHQLQQQQQQHQQFMQEQQRRQSSMPPQFSQPDRPMSQQQGPPPPPPQHPQQQQSQQHQPNQHSQPQPPSQPRQSPSPPRHETEVQHNHLQVQPQQPKPLSGKNRSIFTPIDDSRSVLGAGWDFGGSNSKQEPRVEIKQEKDYRSQSVDVASVQRSQPAPPEPPQRSFNPPQRTQSTASLGGEKRPKLKVQIPSEHSEDEDGGTGGTSPKHSTAPSNDTPAKTESHGSGVVLPPPSPSASALLSAGAQGPPNPFARPLPPGAGGPNAQNAQAYNSNNNIETPVSALPSRFMDAQFLPSPSSFYPEWGFGGQRSAGDSNMLPSPLNWQTPTAANGQNSWNQETDDKKRKSPEGDTHEQDNAKRIKAV